MPYYPPSSPNINYIDFAAAYNLATRTVTLTDQSSFKVGRASHVVGINFKIVQSNTGATIYNNTNFASPDIIPTAEVPFTTNLFLFGDTIAFGTYVITQSVKDEDGTIYTLAKSRLVCQPTQCTGVTGANGCASVSLQFWCQDNKAVIADNTDYTYQSITAIGSAISYSIKVTNPNGVITNGIIPYFELTPIYDGTYNVVVSNAATYSFGDSVTIIVTYTQTFNKKASCVGLCDVKCAYQSLLTQYNAVKGTGNPQEQILYSKIIAAMEYITLANIQAQCGDDMSDTVSTIETITGIDCSCGCGSQNANSGTSLASDQNIVFHSNQAYLTYDQTTVGLTTDITSNFDIAAALETASISDLGDVSSDVPTDGQVLVFDSGSGEYVPTTLTQNGGSLHVDMTPVSNSNNNTENTIYTYTLPAATGTNTPYNTLSQNSDLIHIHTIFQNNLASNANNRTVKVKMGGTTLITLIFSTTSFDIVDMDIELIRTASGAQSINTRFSQGIIASALAVYYVPATATIDLTATNAIVVTCQNAIATASSVVFTEFKVELTKKI